MNGNTKWALAFLSCLSLAGVSRAGDDHDDAPISYRTAPANNPVSRLDARLASGKTKLKRDSQFGYLPALLRELNVPLSSQMLVVSKTSLQRRRISPRTPRAVYFNDDVYVGYCHDGDVLEVSAADPRLGGVFYVLSQTGDEKPRFSRQTDTCLLCHSNSRTQGVPGHVVRSVYPDAQGEMVLSGGSHVVDQTTPWEKRFGGWYVTGTHGKSQHLGNFVVPGRRVSFPVDNANGLNVTDLSKRIDKTTYLSPHSDVVAQLVLAHQAEAHNLITRASFTTRQALHHEQQLNREMKLPADHRWESTGVRIRSAGDDLLKYLLFCEEAVLPGPIKGTSSFAKDFTKRGPFDSKNRSLRDFDLNKRLFAYPCSYLIHSEAFDALPGAVRDYVIERLWRVLTGRDESKEFSHLTKADRKAIHEILAATKPNLPAYFRRR
jgi:hypothetical protein